MCRLLSWHRRQHGCSVFWRWPQCTTQAGSAFAAACMLAVADGSGSSGTRLARAVHRQGHAESLVKFVLRDVPGVATALMDLWRLPESHPATGATKADIDRCAWHLSRAMQRQFVAPGRLRSRSQLCGHGERAGHTVFAALERLAPRHPAPCCGNSLVAFARASRSRARAQSVRV